MTYRIGRRTATLWLTVLNDGLVDVVFADKRGMRQRITIAPWGAVLAMLAPAPGVRIIVQRDYDDWTWQ